MGVAAGTLEVQILTDIAKLQTQMREVKRAVGDMTDNVGRSVGAANDNLGKMGRAFTETANTGRLTGTHMQNLAYQFQDLGVQMTMAAQSKEPLKMAFMVLMQQGSQINGVLSQAGVGIGGMVTQLVAAHPVLTAVAVAVGVASAAIGFMAGEINKNSAVHVTWKDTALGTYDALKAYLTGVLSDAFEAFGVKSSDVWATVVNAAKWGVNWIIGAASLVPRALVTAWDVIPAAAGDIFLSATNSVIRTMNTMIAKAIAILNGFITTANGVLDKAGLGVPTLSTPQIAEVQNSYAGAAAKAGSAFAKVLGDTINRDWIGEGAAYIKPFAEARARKRLEEDAKKAGGAAGKAGAKDLADKFQEELNRLWGGNDKALEKLFGGDIYKRLGIDLNAGIKAMRESLAAQESDAVKTARAAAEATAQWNTEMDAAIDRLERIGGLGSTIAGWAKALRGDFSALGGATGEALKSVLGLSAGTMFDKNTKQDKSVTLGDRIERIFDGPSSKFGKTFKGILESSGTGVAIGSALFGANNQGAQLGGAIGGVAGQAIGQSITKGMSGILGSIGGPLGAIAGGILGSVVGGIFGKKPKGGGTVSNTGVNTWANDGAMKAGLDSFGLGLQQSISSIADRLGGTVGNYSVGIGGYKGGYYQVSRNANDPYLGQAEYSRKSGAAVYDGLDGTAALRAAISVAIEQGAIQGVRAGTQTLLKAGKDIDAQLAKALKFQAVFDDLKQATDPLGYAMDQLTRKFDDLRAIFKEAGATAADYADLEKLLALQRKDAIEQGRADAVSKIADPLNLQIRMLELMGKSEAALAAQRMLEVAGLKSSLQPMQALVYQMEDWRATIDKFTPLAQDLRKFKDEISGSSAGNSYAFLTQQFRTAAAAAGAGDATAMGNLRAYATDYLAAAKDNATSALDYQRAVSEVLAGVNNGIFAAEATADYAKLQMEAAARAADLMGQLNDNLTALAGQSLSENVLIRKLIDQLVNDGFQVTIPVKVV